MNDQFGDLSTNLIADACQRLNIGVRAAPAGIRPLRSGQRVTGRALPLRFTGSIDICLEALGHAECGDVLVVDNKGRLYEGCFNSLIAREAMSAGVIGAVLWGVHRDDQALGQLQFVTFSYGTYPRGPLHARDRHPDALISARVGASFVTSADFVIADADGVIFVEAAKLGPALEMARSIAAIERDQTDRIQHGTSLRDQFAFSEYLDLRRLDPTYTLRRHLRRTGAEL